MDAQAFIASMWPLSWSKANIKNETIEPDGSIFQRTEDENDLSGEIHRYDTVNERWFSA